MNKTPTGIRFRRHLKLVNDQICYSAFSQDEFLRSLKEKKSSNSKVTDTFPNNEFSHRLDVSLEELEILADISNDIGLQHGLITTYELASSYSSEILKFREQLIPHETISSDQEAPEDILYEKVLSWADFDICKEYFETLGYLRLRRNHFAHAEYIIGKPLSNYVRRLGSKLNKFWNNGRTNLLDFDFKSMALNNLSVNDTLVLVSLSRITISEIDSYISKTIPPNLISEEITRKILKEKPFLNSQKSKLSRKVKRVAFEDYGLLLQDGTSG